MELAKASAVEPLGDGRFGAVLDPGWAIGTKPNGGYLLVVLARAAVAGAAGPGSIAELPHPAAVSAHFLAAPDPGPAEVAVEVLRHGRSASQVRATLFAGGRRCVEALVTCGRLSPAAAPYWSAVPVPDLPAEADCVPALNPDERFPVPMFDEVELRADPATAGFTTGRPAMAGEIRGYVRASAAPPDPYAVLIALDALPPATFDLGLVGSWVPTMELTAYLRALPAPGPLRVRQRARLVADGRVDEDCDVWDANGALVGSATQLAALRLP
ncbi:MAG TPA: thioesterase family protein [Mycobacteriales bacterium]|nr:thioesterase family protein [Mycobacteriales bacterium]